jgi:hypothetical protein
MMVLTLTEDRISAITWFGERSLFSHFGLPRTLPGRRELTRDRVLEADEHQQLGRQSGEFCSRPRIRKPTASSRTRHHGSSDPTGRTPQDRPGFVNGEVSIDLPAREPRRR